MFASMENNRKFTETNLVFIPAEDTEHLLSRNTKKPAKVDKFSSGNAEILGIRVKIGNQPLVYNLKNLASKSGCAFSPFQNKEHYLIVHSISAIRTHGKAKVDELQYYATSVDPTELQTVDLVPQTRFNEVFNADFSFTGTLTLSGETSLEIPTIVAGSLLPEFVDIGTDMQLQLCTAAGFIGKFKYNVQIPIIQSGGIGSNSCTWILNPNERKTPLLGDQLLVQSISVPLGCKQVSYRISATIKADKGILWKRRTQKTPEMVTLVKLI